MACDDSWQSCIHCTTSTSKSRGLGDGMFDQGSGRGPGNSNLQH